MRLKHHIILYTFLGAAVLIAIFLTLDFGTRAQRSAQALEDTYAQRVLETQEHLQAIGLKLSKAPAAGEALAADTASPCVFPSERRVLMPR